MSLHRPPASSPAGRLATGLSLGGVGVTLLTHVGYPLAALAKARLASTATPTAPVDDELPSVTVLVPAYNEARFIARKIQDTAAQDYPADRLEILVVDDGSTDGTAAAAMSVAHPSLRVVTVTTRAGKSAAINQGMQQARGHIVVLTDANGSLDPGSLRAIVRSFDHPDVAVVSGRKLPVGEGAHGAGESLYWRFESALKAAEGRIGRVVGADGGIFAVRREHFEPIPGGIFADDYWIPIDALRRGRLVRQANDAVVHERTSTSKRDDFERRQRIAAGIWQVSLTHLDLLHPRHGWTAVAFGCHRVLRSIVVPPLLPVVLVASGLAARHRRIGRWLFGTQLVAYAAAAVGAVANNRACAAPYQFAMANVAALGGAHRHLRRRQTGLWKRTERGEWQSAVAGVDRAGVGEPTSGPGVAAGATVGGGTVAADR